ncbi:MAG TPA: TolC family protein [Bryobacteraceae bacterium]|jgi:outer membrane protein TolC
MRVSALFLLVSVACVAETKTLTLRQALDLALEQNADLVITRLDQQKARDQVIIAKDPFSLHVYAGSGMAYTYGVPTSIDGNAPSIVQAKSVMSLYDRPQTYQVAAAKEAARGASFDVTSKQEEVVYRVTSLYLDAEHSAKSLAAAQQEATNLTRIRDLTEARVQEGREIQHESRKALNQVRHAEDSILALEDSAAVTERTLAMVLGMNPGDRVHPAEEQRPALASTLSPEQAIAAALDRSPEIKRLESSMQVKTLEMKGYKAQWQPKIDLVAQYSLLDTFNNYKKYYTNFQLNNVELGASFSIPVIHGRAGAAYISQAQAEITKLQKQVTSTRSRITADLQQAFDTVKRSDSKRDLARDDLEVAREQTSIDLALLDEGRTTQAAIEKDRADEQSMWIAYYDTQLQSERARLDVMRLSGTLMEALK